MARTNESPMDFQWQQGYGPARTDSPFLHSAMRNQSGSKEPTQHRSLASIDSPKKSIFSSTSHMASQSFAPPSTPSTKLPSQFRNPSFTTPQRPLDLDFSSGAENQSSPANGDIDDTPEPPSRDLLHRNHGAMVEFRAEKKTPLSAISTRHAQSGRGEIQRRLLGDAVARRVHKRKRRDHSRDIKIARRCPSEEIDSQAEGDAPPSKNNNNSDRAAKRHASHVPPTTLIPAFFSYLETHPHLPHILSYYAQFLLNFFLVGVIMYMIFAFWATIRASVDERSQEVAAEILAEMAVCAREYQDNRCGDAQGRVPAMESLCGSWEKCMRRDPSMVGRAKVSAHTFAEIINNFFQPLSAKAMTSLAVLFLGCLAVNNFTMYLFRHKTHPPRPVGSVPAPYYQQQHQGASQQYPGHAADEQNAQTPYKSTAFLPRGDYYGGGSFMESGAGSGSPTKRLAYL
ncbi:MAG: hypothetical protein LQ342_002394 [Letrouitia transgressa]|nr:MAG: hypothetical protein LQ342_002394 [Letrouitia transgressa]